MRKDETRGINAVIFIFQGTYTFSIFDKAIKSSLSEILKKICYSLSSSPLDPRIKDAQAKQDFSLVTIKKFALCQNK